MLRLLIVAPVVWAFSVDDVKSCSNYPQCQGLQGDCCPDAEGLMLDCCEAKCSQHAQCRGLGGFCCPTTDGTMLDCCTAARYLKEDPLPIFDVKEDPLPILEDIKSCSAHEKCQGLEGDCCPNAGGAMLDCCAAKCSQHPKCQGLEGYCCPTADGTLLGCCDLGHAEPLEARLLTDDEPSEARLLTDDVKSCSTHPKCAGLEGECCPSTQGTMLDCCEATAMCSQHAHCAHLEGFCCPTAAGTMLDCCETLPLHSV